MNISICAHNTTPAKLLHLSLIVYLNYLFKLKNATNIFLSLESNAATIVV